MIKITYVTYNRIKSEPVIIGDRYSNPYPEFSKTIKHIELGIPILNIQPDYPIYDKDGNVYKVQSISTDVDELGYTMHVIAWREIPDKNVCLVELFESDVKDKNAYLNWLKNFNKTDVAISNKDVLGC